MQQMSTQTPHQSRTQLLQFNNDLVIWQMSATRGPVILNIISKVLAAASVKLGVPAAHMESSGGGWQWRATRARGVRSLEPEREHPTLEDMKK